MKKLITLIMITAIVLTACSRHKVRTGLPTEKKMELANQYYENNDYRKAIDYYTEVVFERRSVHTPLAQFRLGESFFHLGNYADAIFEYRELLRLFQEFRKNNIAYFRIGQAYFKQSRDPHYCQQETRDAINTFEVFVDRFPFDEKRSEALEYIEKAEYKLLEKKFHNGYIYYKLFDYSAALLYFNEIIAEGMRDVLDKRSRYYSALIHIDRQDRDKVQPLVDSLQEYYPGTRETNRIERLFTRTF